MNRILPALVSLGALVCSLPALAQDEGGTGIVYGADLGVVVSAPAGWIFDAKSGVPQGLHAVMYPKEVTWATAEVMMYVNIVSSNDSSLDAFIAGDVNNYTKQSPQIVVEKADPISMTGGSSAEVRLYSGDQWGNYECVAYVSKGTSVVIYVLSSRDKEGLLQGLGAFRTMVATSTLMDVTIQK